jgi:hypothetical protein
MTSVLNADNYDNVNEAVNALFSAGKCIGVTMNIYASQDGSKYATDTNGGVIVNRQIAKVNKGNSYTSSSGEFFNQYIDVEFKDGSSFKVVDNSGHNFWYSLDIIPFVPRTFL